MARFEELAGREGLDGLDTSETPPWLFVGLGPKTIRLRDAANWSVSNSNQDIINMVVVGPQTVSERRLIFTVSSIGVSTVTARAPSGRQTIQLKVYSRPLVQHNIAFYFVHDSGDHHTRRLRSEVALILQRLNEIYFPQANVMFQQVDVQDVTVPRNLGPHIDIPRQGAGQEFTAIQDATQPVQMLGLRALSAANHARIRVHFVWSVRGGRGHEGDVEGVGVIGSTSLLIEDRLAAHVGTVIAHEVGHCLGLTHPAHADRTVRRGWLMFPTTQGLGTSIAKRHVDILNPAP